LISIVFAYEFHLKEDGTRGGLKPLFLKAEKSISIFQGLYFVKITPSVASIWVFIPLE
jgi:hypothetical protein